LQASTIGAHQTYQHLVALTQLRGSKSVHLIYTRAHGIATSIVLQQM
jgi:hypothetical protein